MRQDLAEEVRRSYAGRPTPADQALVNDWHVVAFSKELAEGKLLAIELLGEPLVAWRHEGMVHVWKDLCIHRGARLSKGWVDSGTVVCPYHGWRYNSDAQCVLIPAHPDTPPPLKARAFSHKAEERYGFIWVCLGDPTQDIPPFPEWADSSFRVFHCGPYPYKANVFRSVENFIDTTHFPFVHAGLNGTMANPDKMHDYQVTTGPDGLMTSGIRVHQPSGDFRQVEVNAEYHFRCIRPAVAYFRKHLSIADSAGAHDGSDDDRFCTFLTA